MKVEELIEKLEQYKEHEVNVVVCDGDLLTSVDIDDVDTLLDKQVSLFVEYK